MSQRMPGVLHATYLVIAKDVVLEARSRARLNAALFFAVMTLLMFSFAVGPASILMTRHAAGFLWLALFLSSTLSLGESMRLEADNDALEGLRLLPVPAVAIFLGKALVNALFLAVLGLLILPVTLALYGASLSMSVWLLVALLLLGALAISAPGTLYAALIIQARAKDALLPLLLFPILVPGLLSVVKATTLVFQGDPMHELGSWMGLLGAFVVVYWALCGVLFGRVIEE